MLPFSPLHSSSSPPLFPFFSHPPPLPPSTFRRCSLGSCLCLGCDCEGSPPALFSHEEHWARVRLYVCVCVCVRERGTAHTCLWMIIWISVCVCVCVCVCAKHKKEVFKCVNLSKCLCSWAWVPFPLRVFQSVWVCIFLCVCVCVLLAQCQVSLMSLSGAVSDGVLPWLSALLQTHCD